MPVPGQPSVLSPARDYFGEVRDAAEEAAERAGGWIERDLRIADAALRLRFAGPALLDAFYGPIAHLEVDSVEDPVTISLFDSATTGTEYPTVPWSRESLDPRGHVREPVGDGITAYHLVHFGAITLFDAASRTGFYWVESPNVIPWYELGSPLRQALHLTLPAENRHLVHAGAVGIGDKGVLIGGRSGSGKSTLTLACVEAGFGYAGDDYVLVTLDPRPVAHTLYTTAKVNPDGLDRLTTLVGKAGLRRTVDKALLDLRGCVEILDSVPVVAVVMPRVRGGAVGALAAQPCRCVSRAQPEHHPPDAPSKRRGPGDDEEAADRRPELPARARRRPAGRGRPRSGARAVSGPLVSVIVPVWNGERFLAEALDSILAQEYEPLEVIVVDDGSTDGSAAIAQARDVRYYVQPNRGPGAARNTGVAAAQGELLAFLDQDDVYLPGKIARQVETLADRPEIGFVFTRIDVFLEPGVERPAWLPADWLVAPPIGYCPSTLMIRRDAFAAVGEFDTDYSAFSDGEWFVRARRAGVENVVLEDVAVRYRIHGSNQSNDRQTFVSEVLRSLRRPK